MPAPAFPLPALGRGRALSISGTVAPAFAFERAHASVKKGPAGDARPAHMQATFGVLSGLACMTSRTQSQHGLDMQPHANPHNTESHEADRFSTPANAARSRLQSNNDARIHIIGDTLRTRAMLRQSHIAERRPRQHVC